LSIVEKGELLFDFVTFLVDNYFGGVFREANHFSANHFSDDCLFPFPVDCLFFPVDLGYEKGFRKTEVF